MNAKLTLNSVAKSFGDNQVLRDISLTINTGEVVSFIGASGSGKTTLLRCINLLETVDSGSILLDNTEITAVGLDPNPIRRRIGIVFQSFNLFPHLSIRRNITLALTEVLGKSADDANETAINLLARFGLSGKIDSYPDRLSGGQQQRVAIARALALNPEVLLLDEITSALDPELVGEVLDVVRELKGSGITLLLATHEMGFAREISDRVCFLADGVVAEMGLPEKIFSHPADPRTQQFLQRVIAAGRLRGKLLVKPISGIWQDKVGILLAQCLFRELANARLWHFINKHHVVGHLPLGQTRTHIIEHFFFCQSLTGVEHYACERTLRPLWMRHADNCSFLDFGVRHQFVFYLYR
jgi:polar amino acid transport system ATP-binding protein